jgi:hypothetical protein
VSRTSSVKHVLAFVGELDAASNRKTRATAEGGGRKGRFYKPFPTQFRRDGFHYRQIYRKGDFAIYRQTLKGNGASAAFEIVRIRKREAFQIGGRFIEPAEVYPRSESWGVDGFTLTDRDAAFAKLREIVSARKKKNRRIP